MELIVTLQAQPILLITTLGLLGLIVGSFLNVVIYRLPISLEKQWENECRQMLHLKTPLENKSADINLFLPRSHCPHCKTPIKIWHNIPVLSYLFLSGKCATCQARIPLQYPLVEILSALIVIILAQHYGLNWQFVAGCVFSWSLLCLLFIDLKHQILPDIITLSLLWLGLLINLNGIFTNYTSALWGVVIGYLTLWIINGSYKLITKRTGMGHGDFKLLACIGAWLGWQQLPLVILLASGTGTLAGLSLILFKGQKRYTPIPFGPYLAFAGWFALMFGKEIFQWYLTLFNN